MKLSFLFFQALVLARTAHAKIATIPSTCLDPVKFYVMTDVPENVTERERTVDDPSGAGGVGGLTPAPSPKPTFDRTPVGNLWAPEGKCDPHMALASCPAGKFKMFFSRTAAMNWVPYANETSGKCINKPDATRVPPGFTGSITTVKGASYIAKTGRNQTHKIQSWVFRWDYRHCYVIEAAARTNNGTCYLTHQHNVSQHCEEFEYKSPLLIERTELIFGCCDMTGDGNITKDVGDLRFADEGTQNAIDSNGTEKKFTTSEGSGCANTPDDLPECEGPFCQTTQTCALRRGIKQLRFDSWPNVSVAERETIFIQVMIIDTGEIFNFTHNTTGFPGKILNGTTPDNFFIRPSFYVENQATFNALYNAQSRDGIAMQFYSTLRGPGGWNACIFSPIGLDIHNTGFVKKIEGNFSINIDGNFNTTTGSQDGDEFLNFWFHPDVGILVHDPPTNGEVTGKHLLGDMGGQFADGYAKLATFDTNQDGEISGAELDKFHLWIDVNSNAHLDAGELHTLAEFNVEALYTHHDCRVSRARLTNTQEIKTEDLWFSRRRR